MGKKSGKKTGASQKTSVPDGLETLWSYLTGSEEDRAQLKAEQTRAGQQPERCRMATPEDYYRELEKDRLRSEASSSRSRQRSSPYADNVHVTSHDGDREEGQLQAFGEVSASPTSLGSLKRKGAASEAAPLLNKEKERRNVTEGSAAKVKEADPSRLVVATRPSEDSMSQEPLRSSAEHVPGKDVLIGSRSAGDKNKEVALLPAETNNFINLQELEKCLAPLYAFFQGLQEVKERVEELGAAAEAPLKGLMTYLRRLGREAPASINLAVQMFTSQQKSMQCCYCKFSMQQDQPMLYTIEQRWPGLFVEEQNFYA
ncbi:uncharacterized protein LOC114648188 [Erpetoichthys calabaricus]|uniref:uncharacterized protein LOC114648188 n=1 Tax=Erpetoichthys calabaricus TaxID=27687 RepID=UPI00223426E6|nr:uncharacterized protein LOC114648188 [Erpetoichthys calabaricus]